MLWNKLNREKALSIAGNGITNPPLESISLSLEYQQRITLRQLRRKPPEDFMKHGPLRRLCFTFFRMMTIIKPDAKNRGRLDGRQQLFDRVFATIQFQRRDRIMFEEIGLVWS
jgi:hypothetical protein